jgi:hydrogenase maturation protease
MTAPSALCGGRPAPTGFVFAPPAPASASPTPLLIAGIGNVLMGDDGVGVHALAALQQEPIPGVTLLDLGTAILHGLSFVETAERVLLIDAVHGGQPPGTIYNFEAGEAGCLPPNSSIHALGLREAMRFLSRRSPPPMSIIGVEPQVITYSLELSAPVQAALPQVVALARSTVARWLRERATSSASPRDTDSDLATPDLRLCS